MGTGWSQYGDVCKRCKGNPKKKLACTCRGRSRQIPSGAGTPREVLSLGERARLDTQEETRNPAQVLAFAINKPGGDAAYAGCLIGLESQRPGTTNLDRVVAVIPGWPTSDRDDWQPGAPVVVLASGQRAKPSSLTFDPNTADIIESRFAYETFSETDQTMTPKDYEAAHPETGYRTNSSGDYYLTEVEELTRMRDFDVARIVMHETSKSDGYHAPNGAPNNGSYSHSSELLDGDTYAHRINMALQLTNRLQSSIDTASDSDIQDIAGRLQSAGTWKPSPDGDLRQGVRDTLLHARTNYCTFGAAA